MVSVHETVLDILESVMKEIDQSWLIERAAKQLKIASQLTSGVLAFSAAVAHDCKHIPLRPAWERHAAKDAEDHRKLQARLRELLGSLNEQRTDQDNP